MMDLAKLYSEGNVFLPVLTTLVYKSSRLPQFHLDEIFPNNPFLTSFCEQVLNCNTWIIKKSNRIYELPVSEKEFVRHLQPPLQHLGFVNYERLFMGDVDQREFVAKLVQQSQGGWNIPASFDPKIKHYLDGLLLVPMIGFVSAEQSLTAKHFKPNKHFTIRIQKSEDGKHNLVAVLSSSQYEVFKVAELILKWFANGLDFIKLDKRLTQRPFVYSFPLTSKGLDILSDVMTFAVNFSLFPFTSDIRKNLIRTSNLSSLISKLDETVYHNTLYCFLWKFSSQLSSSIQAALAQKTEYIVVFNSVAAEIVFNAIGTQSSKPKLVLITPKESEVAMKRLQDVGIPYTAFYSQNLSPEALIAAITQDSSQKMLFVQTFVDCLLPQPLFSAGGSQPPQQMLAEYFQSWHKTLQGNSHRLMFLAMHGLQESREIQDYQEALRLPLTWIKSLCADPTPMIPANDFLMCAAQAGLFPTLETTKRIPGDNHITEFSVHCFVPQEFQVRRSLESDMDILLEIESKCWSERLRSSQEELSRRIQEYPEGQLVLIRQGKVIGCMYSQRVPSLETLRSTTFRECKNFLDRSGTTMQFLGINVLPEFQWLGLGDDLMEFMQHISATRYGIRHTGAITRCAKYSSVKDSSKIEDYIHSKGPDGLPLDPILKFHASHGATVVGPVPGFRPEDVDNGGVGVMVQYDVLNRVRKAGSSFNEESSTPTAATLSPSSTAPSMPSMTSQEIREFVKETAKKLLGKDEVSETRSLMEMGLDSLALQEFREILESKLVFRVQATDFFQYYNLQLLSDYLIEQFQTKYGPKIVEGPAVPPSEFQVLIMSGTSTDSEKLILHRKATELSSASDWKKFCLDTMRKPQGAQRYAVYGDSKQDMLRTLKGSQDRLLKFENAIIPVPPPPHKFAYVFGSLGTEYLNMGKDLYDSSKVFRTTFQECDAKLRPFLSNQSILDIVFPPPSSTDDEKTKQVLLHKYAYPALFVIEYSIAKLWESMGVKPHFVTGHSWGEFIAACYAGVIRLEDGLRIAATAVRWSSLVVERSGTLIIKDEISVRAMIAATKKHSTVCVVAVNNGDQVMIAGPDGDVAEVIKAIKDRHGAQVIHYPDFPTFHTPSVDLFFEELESIFDELKYSAPSIPIISCIHGRVMADASVVGTSRYWKKMFSSTVYFVHSIRTLMEQEVGILINTSPNRNVLAAIQQYTVVQKVPQFLLLTSMKTPEISSRLLTVFSLAQLFLVGYDMTKVKYECLE